MITNSKLTLYHKTISNHSEVWTRYNISNVWWFGGKGASTNRGYENANDVQVRIPYSKNENLSASNFEIGDIIVKGELQTAITTQQDLNSYEFYNITAINNNTFGNEPHIHLSGK